MIRTLALLTLALLAGCGQKPIDVSNTDNPKVSVDKLFTHDGCTVYRFIDSNRVYFTKCVAASADTSWTESCGKNCTRTVTNRTESQP